MRNPAAKLHAVFIRTDRPGFDGFGINLGKQRGHSLGETSGQKRTIKLKYQASAEGRQFASDSVMGATFQRLFCKSAVTVFRPALSHKM